MRESSTTRARWLVVLVVITAIGFLARFAIMVRGGGLTGVGGYDDGVYFAAADAFVHGRLPYRDFLFLQPPGIVVAAAPFAALGSATSDAIGFATARLAFMLVGGMNAVLVAACLRRFRLTAAVIGGLFYAVFSPAVYAERSVLLEPLGTLGILLAVQLLQRAVPGRRSALLAGLAAGAAVDMKIWYVAPAVVIAVLAAGQRRRFGLAALATIAAGYLPFMAAAPVASIREILLDQLGRPRSARPLLTRFAEILGARAFGPVPVQTVAWLLMGTAAAFLIVTATAQGARLFAALLAVDALVLVATPSWYVHYGALTAPPLALCLGVTVARLLGVARRRSARVSIVAVVLLAVVATNEGQDRRRVGTAVPAVITAAATRTSGCVIADDPTVLASANLLSRDLSNPRCVLRPDVTGYTYDRDDLQVNGVPIARRRNPRWQRDVLRYLESGQVVILARRDTGLDRASLARVRHGRLLARSGSFELRSTR